MKKLVIIKIIFLIVFFCNFTNVYAYDFDGNYKGKSKNGIIQLHVYNNQISKVIVKCSDIKCNMSKDVKTLIYNHGTALITELKPLPDNNNSIAYTTLIITPTNDPNKIQAVLVGYRKNLKTNENNLKYEAEFSSSEILTKIL